MERKPRACKTCRPTLRYAPHTLLRLPDLRDHRSAPVVTRCAVPVCVAEMVTESGSGGCGDDGCSAGPFAYSSPDSGEMDATVLTVTSRSAAWFEWPCSPYVRPEWLDKSATGSTANAVRQKTCSAPRRHDARPIKKRAPPCNRTPRLRTRARCSPACELLEKSPTIVFKLVPDASRASPLSLRRLRSNSGTSARKAYRSAFSRIRRS
jgi:hypothetical protein